MVKIISNHPDDIIKNLRNKEFNNVTQNHGLQSKVREILIAENNAFDNAIRGCDSLDNLVDLIDKYQGILRKEDEHGKNLTLNLEQSKLLKQEWLTQIMDLRNGKQIPNGTKEPSNINKKIQALHKQEVTNENNQITSIIQSIKTVYEQQRGAKHTRMGRLIFSKNKTRGDQLKKIEDELKKIIEIGG